MPCCAAHNCSNHSRHGFQFFRFPACPERRKKWLINCSRGKWIPTQNDRLCAVHFEATQFETKRADGKVKLSPFAIPTIFNIRSRKGFYKKSSNEVVENPKDIAGPSSSTVHSSSILTEVATESKNDKPVTMKTDDSSPSILQFQDFCRTCLKEVDVKINIFKYMLEDDSVLVSEALRAALPLTVEEDDKLPQQMCSDCLVALSQSYAFMKKSLQTHEVLMSCLDVIDNEEANKSDSEELITIINEELLVVKPVEQDVVVKIEEGADNSTEIEECAASSIETEEGAGSSVETEEGVDNSMQTEESDDEIADSLTVFNCNVCNQTYTAKKDLVKHMQTHVENVKRYGCDRCDKKFSFKHNLARHELIHGLKKFVCPRCDKAFFTRQQRNSHLKTHQATDYFICEQCGNRYKFQHLLMRHLKTYHTVHFPETKREKPESESETETSDKQKQPISAGAGFLCDDCGKHLKTKVALKLHMRIHTGEKPHICQDCGRTFSQGSSLIYHRRTHTGEKPYCCGVCLRTFSQPAHLKTHMKTHTGERPYDCPFCGKDFALKKNMVVHTRIHTGERPFPCHVCDKKFVDASSRKKHVKLHHIKGLDEIETPMEKSPSEVEITPVFIVKSEV